MQSSPSHCFLLGGSTKKDRQIMMASTSSARSKPGLSLIEDEYWYAGALSERKAEIILTKLGEPGCFLVRDSLLPDADYVLSVNSGKDIWHYDIQVLPSNECIFNEYTFTSLPDAVMFYTENRLGSVFLKEPEEPVVSEAQLKSFGPSVIKSAAPGSIKPPRTSPFVSAENATTILTSSPQTRRLVAPESLRSPSPCTPPAMSAKSHHTSSPQSRKLTAPESIKPPHKMQFASVDTHTNASPRLQHREPEPDRGVVSDTTNPITLSALPRSADLVGDGWLETHSGAGSQVSLGSHSPKPQSVHPFVVDLEESAGTSQISSQTSEVDTSYIAPSKEVESVYITSGYMYVAPPSSEFDGNSSNRENNKKQTFKEQYSPKHERGEDGTKAEICETQFDSSGVPTTAILDTPSSAESTPVRHVGSLATEHITAESGYEYALQNKSSPNNTLKKEEKEKIDESIKEDQVLRKSSNGNSEPDDGNELPSVASRRLAFEQKAQISKESDRISTSKPVKQPPAIPKRVSSISSMQKQENGPTGVDQNAPNPVKIGVPSSLPLQEENGAQAIAEEMPPPPPMSTHPGVIAKSPMVTEPIHSEQQKEEKENEPVREETEMEQEQEDEPMKEIEMPKPEEELQDARKLRPVPKERRTSIPAVKPIEPKEEQDSSTEPLSDIKPTPVIQPSTETSTTSNESPQDEIDGIPEDDEVTSTSTFGHTASPTKPNLPTVAITSERPTDEERTALDDIDPSKKIGAEVSTFKPIPKPRSTHRLSAAYDSSAAPTVPALQDKAPPPKIYTNNITTPCSPPPTYTPEMKRSSAYYPTPINREFLLRAQSMSVLPTTGSASPRMVARGEQKQQMPPGFVVFSRSQEAVIGRTATLTSSMMRRTIQIDSGNKKGDGELTASAPPPTAGPMNTKRGPTKKRRSLFRRK